MIPYIFIPGNVPSSKNSTIKGKNGIFMSKAARNWVKTTDSYFEANKPLFLSMIKGLSSPLYIEYTFHRKINNLFDYTNINQIVQDQMSKHNWINDDNGFLLKPYFGDFIHNKENPGVYIRVLRNKPSHYIDKKLVIELINYLWKDEHKNFVESYNLPFEVTKENIDIIIQSTKIKKIDHIFLTLMELRQQIIYENSIK